jgi:hypothetical protein
MLLLVLKAYGMLIVFDLQLRRGSFARVYDKVRTHRVNPRVPPHDAVRRICFAVDIACMCYWKQVRCLERSSATACLLKTYGVPAQMVIGAQQLPFRAHAWVEVAGAVVNDKPYTQEMYAVLDRC